MVVHVMIRQIARLSPLDRPTENPFSPTLGDSAHRPALSTLVPGWACEIELLLTATLRQQPDNQTTVKMRGPGKHQKRLSAPSHWLLDKLSGSYAPKASPGPHKLRDCMPLIVFIRNRYATRKNPTLGKRARRCWENMD